MAGGGAPSHRHVHGEDRAGHHEEAHEGALPAPGRARHEDDEEGQDEGHPEDAPVVLGGAPQEEGDDDQDPVEPDPGGALHEVEEGEDDPRHHEDRVAVARRVVVRAAGLPEGVVLDDDGEEGPQAGGQGHDGAEDVVVPRALERRQEERGEEQHVDEVADLPGRQRQPPGEAEDVRDHDGGDRDQHGLPDEGGLGVRRPAVDGRAGHPPDGGDPEEEEDAELHAGDGQAGDVGGGVEAEVEEVAHQGERGDPDALRAADALVRAEEEGHQGEGGGPEGEAPGQVDEGRHQDRHHRQDRARAHRPRRRSPRRPGPGAWPGGGRASARGRRWRRGPRWAVARTWRAGWPASCTTNPCAPAGAADAPAPPSANVAHGPGVTPPGHHGKPSPTVRPPPKPSP